MPTFALNRFANNCGRCLRWCATTMFALALLPAVSFGQIISTVAGGGSLDGYFAVGTNIKINAFGFDRQGTLHLTSGNRFLRVAADGTLFTLAGDGAMPQVPALGIRVVPTDLNVGQFCFDAADNLMFTESARIQKVAPNGVVTTLAGTGVLGSEGDGGPAAAAQVYAPTGITCANGNVYFFDLRRIRRISADGIITSIAKWNGGGYAGDGGSALLGNFYGPPYALGVDAIGNVFVADSYNRRVRKIDSGGMLSTVAGDGTVGFSGDGGPATQAAINIPMSVAVEPGGDLVISDWGNQRLRRISGSGTISTIAGTGDPGFSGEGGSPTEAMLNRPAAVAISPAGEVHFFDSENFRIRKLTRDRRIVTVVGADAPAFGADGNPASNAQVSPLNPFVDAQGNIYFVDTYRIRKISTDGRISAVAGSGIPNLVPMSQGDGGPATRANLLPGTMTTDGAGNLYIGDGSRVRKVSPGGTITTFAGGGFFSPPSNASNVRATDALISSAVRALVFDPAGNLLIGAHSSIYKVTPGGTISLLVTSEGGTATNPLPVFSALEGMAIDPSGTVVFSDSGNSQILRISPAGVLIRIAGTQKPELGYAPDGAAAISGRLGDIRGPVAVAPDGSVVFTESSNHRVRRITPQGTLATIAGNGSAGFAGDGGPAAAALLTRPVGVAIDVRGDLYVAETSRVRKISASGGTNYSDMWWAGSIENGWGMSILQHASGMQFNALYVYDDAGEPRWYVMPGGNWSNNFTTFQGALYQPKGAALDAYTTADFAPGAPVGTATIRFTSNLVAELSYAINGVTGSKRLQRMNFFGGVPAMSVADMWWGGETENGWGISIAQQGATLFSLWYTYGRDNKARWFVMPGGSWNGISYAGPFYTTAGARWLGAAFDPAAIRVDLAGFMSLSFTSPDVATLSYTFTTGPFAGTNQNKAIRRMAF